MSVLRDSIAALLHKPAAHGATHTAIGASVLALCVPFAAPAPAVAGPDACVELDNVITCSGNQSAGIARQATPPADTLVVKDLAVPVAPAGGDGIHFNSVRGGNLNVHTGTPEQRIEIETDGNDARGIHADSVGQPGAPSDDPFLGVPLPGSPNVSGGVVTIENYGDVDTDGVHAYGIAGFSSTSGYPQGMITELEQYQGTGVTFAVTGVRDASDASSVPLVPDPTNGATIAGRIAIVEEAADDLREFAGYAGTAGEFTLFADGEFEFDPGDDFDDLAVGESRYVSVGVSVDGFRNGGAPKLTGERGELVAVVTKTAEGADGAADTFEIETSARFDTFGTSTRPAADGLVWPDVVAYVRGLAEQAQGAGGAGNNVIVRHLGGEIATDNAAAHGIVAESRGQAGARGDDGGGFFTFGLDQPHRGGNGNFGGEVTVRVDGTITVAHAFELNPNVDQHGLGSAGVFAHSQGGAGGRGGDGGTYYYGRQGGDGGAGSLVEVLGSGTITTAGHYGVGILALSEGGDGADGGGGAELTGGAPGGAGGVAGDVLVHGAWNITTRGVDAYGIWAKSTGGDAGTGGSGGWLVGAPGGGGIGSNGADVMLESGGRVETFGTDAFALFGQSVGGFGGSGGRGRGIFYSRGGSGDSAGSGGDVTVTNGAGGKLYTHGLGAHALVSLSVGGGGGAGGGSAGIVAVGGAGASGGLGGTATANNLGAIYTYGDFARGVHAQSVGGGGGDGGSAGGIGAIGGKGSGTSDGGEVHVTNTGTIETGLVDDDGNVVAGAWSEAIFAQSIGGGGGSGGSSSGWFSIGGGGGGGGAGKAVTVDNSGALLRTRGADASAIVAQSVGGGGGSGGNSTAAGAFGSLAIGGNGDKGGAAGTVDVTSTQGAIETRGDRSRGIDAQSIGGGGGRGGFAISAAAGPAIAVAVGIGGTGGAGGDAETVEVENHSAIDTRGVDAQGIFAQSIGGGGGSGGFSLAGAGSDGVGVALSFGGKGGEGGDGKRVDVTNTGTIDTAELRSVGLFAQSIGGGGGNGGFSIAGSGGGLGGFSLGVGGDGSAGGDGAEVEVTSGGAITTLGDEAHGLQAQSVGGGGGNGGFTIGAAGGGVGAGAVTIGGRGEGGGSASGVIVHSSGRIETGSLGEDEDEEDDAGDRAIGLFAQSVGGGGGSGGFSIAAAGAGTGAGTFALGGEGSLGGDSGTVDVYSTGDILTHGSEAHALFAQSLGGGGGNGGFSISGSGAGVGAASLALGGGAGPGGDSARVYVESGGALGTDKDGAIGLFAQSVGGGGGSGGFSIVGAGAGTGAATFGLGGAADEGGDGHEVEVLSTGDITTYGAEAHALFAQSLGGGGGNGGFSIAGAGAGTGAATLGLGGKGAGGGTSKLVEVTSRGELHTEGGGAIGLFAQSVGGGGGSGGFSIAGAGAGTGAGTFSLGGAAGGGSDGAGVDVDNFGKITTVGADAHALFAQSVGGGGGNGGFSIAGAGAGTGAGTLGLGGKGAGAGAGKRVDVCSEAELRTGGAAAVGLFAQSVGGGGGAGGFSIAGAGAGQGAGTVSLGGSAGGGGNGGEVIVDNRGLVVTAGTDAYGLFAQSVGGGGGRGGFSISGSGAKTFGGTVSLGASGGDGGTGSNVTVGNSARIETGGTSASALFAQSIGGGGGNGGFNVSGSLGGGSSGTAVTVGVGGSGGDGGGSALVRVTNSGELVAVGDKASGILAQSIGGGGGNGGFSIAGSFLGAQNATVTVGGAGGDGGAGGAVQVDNRGDIGTQGNEAHGIRAQSTSDGGGDGGFALSGSLGGKEAKNIAITVGGSGGLGGRAGDVAVDSAGVVRTAGEAAHGVFATSIGGGGGNGGSSIGVGFGIGGEKSWNVSANVSVGGTGGDAGEGGAVRVGEEEKPVTGEIRTGGDDSHGIFAQSIGGGGGSGGSATAINIDVDRPKSEGSEGGNTFAASIAVGGAGGAGNKAAQVDVDNASLVVTRGAQSHGIYAQSIGGGGGNGGRSAALSLSTSDLMPWKETQGDNWGLDVSVGGPGGDGNTGGAVTVRNSGRISTAGTLSRGIAAQSVGGGGGSGAQGVLGTGVDWLDDALEVLSPVQMAFELKGIIESPKDALPKSASISVGGSGGSNADAADVRIENSGDVDTAGMSAHAIFAQSIGGGGGEAQLYARGTGEGAEAAVGIGLLGEIAIGGAGGAAGNGAAVDVMHTGRLETTGQAASGIFAQSIGGGGGQAGSITGGFADASSIGLGLAFGRDGGSAGNGGRVTIDSRGEIVTAGEASVGIFAQSVGGGGGIIGDVGGIAFAGGVGGDGAGGIVTVQHTGSVLTSGKAAHAIMAQSIGGGAEGEYSGRGGDVAVTVDGAVDAAGADAHAILAQSLGLAGNGNVTVTIAEGAAVRGGTGSGAGVRVQDGGDNRITNRGSLEARSGLAIGALGGNDTVDNYGRIVGNVDLGAGTNRLANRQGGMLATGASIVLGAGNVLENAGVLSPGGAGTFATTTIDGDLAQLAAGSMLIDLDVRRAAADAIVVTGGAALDGSVALVATQREYAKPGSFRLPIVSAGSLYAAGVDLGFTQSAVARYALAATDTELALEYAVDFSARGLGANQTAFGDYVNAVQTAGGSAAFAPIAAYLFALPDAAALSAAYEQLSPDVYGGIGAVAAEASAEFGDAMLSCPAVTPESRFAAEEDCSWIRATARDFNHDRTPSSPGFVERASGLAGGVQRELRDGVHLGFALAYEDSRMHSGARYDNDGKRYQAGLMLKRIANGNTAAVGLSTGFANYDSARVVALPVGDTYLRSRQSLDFVAVRGRFAHTIETESFYLRPLIDAQITYTDIGAFTEIGLGTTNLSVDEQSDTEISLNPAVEVGAQLGGDDGRVTQLFGRVGVVRYLSDMTPSLSASLASAPAGIAPFTATNGVDSGFVELSFGANLLRSEGIDLRFEYAVQVGDHSRAEVAQLKFTAPLGGTPR